MSDLSADAFGLVIPTRGRPSLVRDAVRSALGQSRPFDRVVVVCDGAQPDTQAALADLDCEVVVIDRGGVSAARNRGVAALDTEWVVFLDDDDLLHPEYLATVEAGVGPGVDAVNTHYLVMAEWADAGVDLVAADYDETLRALPGARPSRSFAYMHIWGRSFDRLLERLRGSLTGSAVRRDTLRRAGGFPEDLRCAEDWAMYVNVARLCEWATIDQPLVVVRTHGGVRGTTHGGVRNGLDTLRAIASFWGPSDLPTPPHRPLAAYRDNYRYVLRWTLGLARRDRDRQAYRESMRIARTVLRWRDRQLARVPAAVWNAGRRVFPPSPSPDEARESPRPAEVMR